MKLLEKQFLFSKLIAKLIGWIYEQGWSVTLADGSIDLERKVRTRAGLVFVGEDAQHMKGSLHYTRLAQDLNLFIDGEWISDGGHPVWTKIGTHWEALDPLCRWGGRFGDSNHFSLEHGGKS